MSEANPIAQLQRRLLELGCPMKAVRKIVRETAEHYEDLQKAALVRGLTPEAALVQASGQLGNPQQLAERHLEALRNSSWLARHALFGFGILPAAAILGLAFLCWCFDGGRILWDDPWHYLRSNAPWVYPWMVGILWSSTIAVTAVIVFYFCWGAQRFAVARKWMWVAGGVLAAHGLFVQTKPAEWAWLERVAVIKEVPTTFDRLATFDRSTYICVVGWWENWSEPFQLYSKRTLRTWQDGGPTYLYNTLLVVKPGKKVPPDFTLLQDEALHARIAKNLAEIRQEQLLHPPLLPRLVGRGEGWRVNGGLGRTSLAGEKPRVEMIAYVNDQGLLDWQERAQVPFQRPILIYSPIIWAGDWRHWFNVILPLLIVAAMQLWQRRKVNRLLRDEDGALGAARPTLA